ncbi:MAG: SGNH/GDSL hydrolase family protein [Chloroflexi bacterium]|nr:SGNH/GDSL hydrolase family protein [Chloroflexota bacterium]
MNCRRLYPTLISIGVILSALSSSGCQPLPSGSPVSAIQTMVNTPIPTLVEPIEELSPTPTSVVTELPEEFNPNLPDSWQTLPVIPETISQKMKDLYQTGKTMGVNPHSFSKVGDCETFTDLFLAPFDFRESGYRLGEYTSLDEMISYYSGSYSRKSLAAERGFNAASVLSSAWAANKIECRINESPLYCEIRENKPAIVLVMFGTNDAKMSSRESFEKNLRRILDILLANSAIPVLATKADNLEGDGSINAIIAKVGYEYQVPIWNYWRAIQDLPNGGLLEDQVHLTYAQPFFDNAENMQKGWPVRNLTALQMLEMITRELNQ